MAWVAEPSGSHAKYLAVFNIGDAGDERIRIDWSGLGLPSKCVVRDLTAKQDIGTVRMAKPSP